MGSELYRPDFDEECYHCGSSPCVVVIDHVVPETKLCGICFFHDTLMLDWSLWNEKEDENV
jgi:hypothetical protein